MTLLDFIETWWLSVRELLEAGGVTGRFERSPIDRLNPSCSLNLRRGKWEADLLVWESGEAELSTAEPDGRKRHQHLNDIRNPADLGSALSRLVALLPIAKK